MSERVYLPVTAAELAALAAEGSLAGPRRAHAVTDALREQWPDADLEDWEYAALMAAASASLAAAAATEDEAPRRHVVAADVPAYDPVPGEDPTEVEVTAEVRWRDVAAAHVDTVDGADPDEAPGWYARQEIRHLG